MTKLGTASPLKLRISQIVASDTAGRIIGAVTRNRIRHHGLWFDVRSDDFSPSVRAQIFWGSYEGAETRMIRTYLPGAKTVVELGSSLGVTTAHVARAMAPGGHLVCVEANPSLLPGLRERTRRLASRVRVDMIHGAVSGHCGQATLTVASDTLGSRIGSPRRHETTVQVPALTLREILSVAGVSEYDLVCDIEGSEASFLLKDTGVLEGCGRAVMELHDTTIDGADISVADLMNAAEAAGFRIAARHGPAVALVRP